MIQARIQPLCAACQTDQPNLETGVIALDYMGSPLSFLNPGIHPLNTHRYFHGPSGSGKSSFFRCLAGQAMAGTGLIRFNINQTTPGATPRLECFLGLVPQDFALLEGYSPREQITIHCQAGRFPVQQPRVLSMARKLEISDCLDRKVETLSRGERQRVAILRALSRPFGLLLADEPFSHLDEARSLAALELMLACAKEWNAGLWILDLEAQPGWLDAFLNPREPL